jgi:hypothetical protein
MRIALLTCIILLICLASGCGSRPEASSPRSPILAGKLEGGTFWKTSLHNSTTTNDGGGYDKGSRVEVHDQFVVVTTPDGISHVHPHGFYSELRIKKD